MFFCLGDFLKDTQALYQTPTLSTRNLCGENKKCLMTAPNVIFPIPGNYSICFHMQYSRFTLLIFHSFLIIHSHTKDIWANCELDQVPQSLQTASILLVCVQFEGLSGPTLGGRKILFIIFFLLYNTVGAKISISKKQKYTYILTFQTLLDISQWVG